MTGVDLGCRAQISARAFDGQTVGGQNREWVADRNARGALDFWAAAGAMYNAAAAARSAASVVDMKFSRMRLAGCLREIFLQIRSGIQRFCRKDY